LLELSFLGSGSAFCKDGRYWSAFLLNGRYLFDAPPTTLPQLRRLGRATKDIDVIFISHFHGDHFAGLPFLLLDYSYVTRRERDLTIVGPPGCQDFLESFNAMCYPSLRGREDDGYRRIYLEAAPGQEQTVAEVSFAALPVPHAAGLQSFGYRVTIGGRSVAYTGDCEYSEAVLQLAHGADVLVMDCTHAERGPLHMGFADALELRRQLPRETAIVLTHRESDPDVSGLENVFLAQDLATLRF